MRLPIKVTFQGERHDSRSVHSSEGSSGSVVDVSVMTGLRLPPSGRGGPSSFPALLDRDEIA